MLLYAELFECRELDSKDEYLCSECEICIGGIGGCKTKICIIGIDTVRIGCTYSSKRHTCAACELVYSLCGTRQCVNGDEISALRLGLICDLKSLKC